MAAGKLPDSPDWRRTLFSWAVAMSQGLRPKIGAGGMAVLNLNEARKEVRGEWPTTSGVKGRALGKKHHRRSTHPTTPRARGPRSPASSREGARSEVRHGRRHPTDSDRVGMEERYPKFQIAPHHPRSGGAFWTGWVHPFRPSVTDVFQLEVLYLAKRDPRVYVVTPQIDRRSYPQHPHLYADGAICSYHPDDGSWVWGRDDISRMVDMTVGWLVEHLCWREFGVWPGEEYPH